MSDEKILYIVVVFGLLALGWVAYSTFQAPPATANSAVPAGANLAPVQVPSECGDINDPANLQHLSHHPDRFQACYRIVDPVKFKQAVGSDISEFMR